MFKKGISPLIATILLIGFTIVLAALVMRWGSQLFETTSEEIGCESEALIACTSNVDLEIASVNKDGETHVSNGGNVELNGVWYILYDNTGQTLNATFNQTKIPAYQGGAHNFNDSSGIVTPPQLNDKVTKGRVIPVIRYETRDGQVCVVDCTSKATEKEVPS